MHFENYIRDIQGFPKEGILFKDITPLLNNPEARTNCLKVLLDSLKNQKIDKVVGAESRGFFFGMLLAQELNAGFVPVRKPGKLPRATISQTYELEYGKDTLEIHTDAINANDKVLVIDDLLATGGTIEATVKLIRELGGEVGHAAFVISLPEIGGEKRLHDLGIEVLSLCEFDGE